MRRRGTGLISPPMTRFKLGYRRIAGAVLATLAAACSPLRTFDALVPKDSGVRQVVRGAAFGPHPRQRVDVYAPKRPGAPLPVIVFLYGGSWNSGTRGGYGFVGRALASRGFVVAVPDYRLVPEIRYPAFLQDNAAAVRWVRANAASFGGDPDRLVIAGHSAGAYNAAMLAIDPRWLGKDGQAVKGWIGLAGPYDFAIDSPVTRAAFGHVADPAGTQPITHAAAGDPPALLLTGDSDTLVLPRNSDALAARLQRVGVSAERRRYPVGHVGLLTAIARPLRGRASVLADMTAFATRVTELK